MDADGPIAPGHPVQPPAARALNPSLYGAQRNAETTRHCSHGPPTSHGEDHRAPLRFARVLAFLTIAPPKTMSVKHEHTDAELLSLK